MRGRLVLIAVALAFLVLAGTGHPEHSTPALQATHSTPGHLAAQPSPEPAWPTILGAGAAVSITLQTPVGSAWSHPHRPTAGAFAVRRLGRIDRARTARQRHFPLLI